VIDVSFISLQLIFPAVVKELASGGQILSLVKPQFELESAKLAKGGIVRNPTFYAEVRDKILALCVSLNLNVKDYFFSSIEGNDGNKEFFVWIGKI
jgi:23S rRNA (cytidine1920-2'-O)/16S rRNA (cytidine1409-2'-O)-methyltransferase